MISRPAARRIGLMVPSSNTTMEPEFYRFLPENYSLHTARLLLKTIAYDSWGRMNQEIEQASELLATADVDIICFGCTGASFAEGLGFDEAIARRIEKASGKPAVTTSTAVVEALRAVGARRIVLGTPYPEPVNDIGRRFFEANGFEVLAIHGLGHADNLKVGRLAPESVLEVARAVYRPDADAILLSCTNWHTFGVLDAVEAEYCKPVVNSNQASLWAVLQRLAPDTKIPGLGSLLNPKKA